MTPRPPRPAIDGKVRLSKARSRREAMVANSYAFPVGQSLKVLANSDNTLDQRPIGFGKGLLHDVDGKFDPRDFDILRDKLAGVSGPGLEIDPDFTIPRSEGTWQPYFKAKNPSPGGSGFRKFESPLTGLYYDNQGADLGSVAMHAAPELGSSELVAEIAEVYAMAVTRDMTFEELGDPNSVLYRYHYNGTSRRFTKKNWKIDNRDAKVADLIEALGSLSWIKGPKTPPSSEDTPYSQARWGARDLNRLFSGSTTGSNSGFYISQFMYQGTNSRIPGEQDPNQGYINFGVNRIDQRVDRHKTGVDYMTSFAEWLDVQNGVNLANLDLWEPRRFLLTPRDLATYVHLDALYQAYFNACLLLLDGGIAGLNGAVPSDKGMPESALAQGATNAHRTGFASFGGPHVLSLLTEVATRALRAVRRQKFQVHLRGRPERLAALISLGANKETQAIGADAMGKLASMISELGIDGTENKFTPIMTWISELNEEQNRATMAGLRNYEATGQAPTFDTGRDKYLLPMAFPEGSPMHASYGAGHATVAGACTTMLKAFFELNDASGAPLTIAQPLKPDATGDNLVSLDMAGLTLEGELNKLAANISLGRNMAGVHYYSDYFDSLRMGERVAVAVLYEQMAAYSEPVSITLNSFDGDELHLSTSGFGDAQLQVNGINADEWWVRHVANVADTAADGELYQLFVSPSNWDPQQKAS